MSAASYATLAALGLAIGGCTGAIGDPMGHGGPGSSGATGTGSGGNVTGSTAGTGTSGSTGTTGATGTTGTTGGVDPQTGKWQPAPCDNATSSFGQARLWQITDVEYVNSVRDVLGITLTGADADISSVANSTGEYSNLSEGGAQFSDNTAQNYQTAAQKVATLAVAPDRMLALLGTSTTAASPAQLDTFIATKVARLWRRPVTAMSDEALALKSIYMGGVADGAANAFNLLLQAVLQAPSFLFRTELGDTAPASKPFQLSPYELATAVSFLFTDSAPDDSLWAKAANGTLASPDVLAAEVDRLQALPLAQANMSKNLSYWLWTERVPARQKDLSLYPEVTPTLSKAVYDSGRMFVNDVVTKGKLWDLFTSPKVYVNKEMSTVFGIPGGIDATLVPVSTTLAERSAGLLTQPALLWSTNKRAALADPIHHGLFVLENLLCGGDLGDIPGPPPDAFAIAAKMMGNERELADLRAKTAPCSGCHPNFDPFGLTRMAYDAIGRYRPNQYVSVDNSVMPAKYGWTMTTTPIDTSGTIPELVGPDLKGPLADSRALAEKLNSDGINRRVAHCAGRWLALFSLGTDPGNQNSCVLQTLKEHLYQSGSITQFYRELATSSGFATRDPGQ